MNDGEFTEGARRRFDETLALMTPDDRGFVEALPVAPSQVGFRSAGWLWAQHGFAWHLGDIDGGRYAIVHLLLPEVADGGFHSHYWDNESTILSGGYIETWRPRAWDATGQAVREFRTGDKILRPADAGHHLALLPGLAYTLTAFVTGPKIREATWKATFTDGVVGPLHHYRPAP